MVIRYKNLREDIKKHNLGISLMMSLFSGVVAAIIINYTRNPSDILNFLNTIIAIGLFIILYILIKKSEDKTN